MGRREPRGRAAALPRRGPRRGRRIKRAPDVSSGALVRACLLVELHQSGEMLIALLGGPTPPGRGPPGTPSLFYLSGGTEFRRYQGFGPTAQNAWTAQKRRGSKMAHTLIFFWRIFHV